MSGGLQLLNTWKSAPELKLEASQWFRNDFVLELLFATFETNTSKNERRWLAH